MILFLSLACTEPAPDTGATEDTCPRDGTVLPDARDVERDACSNSNS